MSTVRFCPEAPFICGNSSAVEHRLAKAGVASSNLVSRSIHSSIAQSVEQSAVNRSVVGSSPTRGAIFIGPLVKRLRHRPFTAVSGVRFPHGSPYGRLAQLGERLPYKQDVGSSILSSSTISLCTSLFRRLVFLYPVLIIIVLFLYSLGYVPRHFY